MKKRVTKRNRRIADKKWWVSGLITFFVLLGVLGSVTALNADKIIDHNISKGNQQVTLNQVKKDNNQPKHVTATYDFKAIKPINLVDSMRANQVRNRFYHTGMIAIPHVKVKAVINKGMNPLGLYTAVGEAKPGQIMGEENFAIGGHNNYGYARNNYLFSNLNSVVKGDKIYLTNGSKTYQYVTTEIKVIKYTESNIILNSEAREKPIVTLFTCWSPNHENNPKHRLMVRGELQKITNQSAN